MKKFFALMLLTVALCGFSLGCAKKADAPAGGSSTPAAAPEGAAAEGAEGAAPAAPAGDAAK